MFNYNYGQAKASAGDFKEAEEVNYVCCSVFTTVTEQNRL